MRVAYIFGNEEFMRLRVYFLVKCLTEKFAELVFKKVSPFWHYMYTDETVDRKS